MSGKKRKLVRHQKRTEGENPPPNKEPKTMTLTFIALVDWVQETMGKVNLGDIRRETKAERGGHIVTFLVSGLLTSMDHPEKLRSEHGAKITHRLAKQVAQAIIDIENGANVGNRV